MHLSFQSFITCESLFADFALQSALHSCWVFLCTVTYPLSKFSIYIAYMYVETLKKYHYFISIYIIFICMSSPPTGSFLDFLLFFVQPTQPRLTFGYAECILHACLLRLTGRRNLVLSILREGDFVIGCYLSFLSFF